MTSPRPVVRRFAVLMEEVLRANDHKTGWLDMSVRSLMDRLEQEVAELREVLDTHVPTHGISTRALSAFVRRQLLREAADVANFALMIADETEWRIGNEATPLTDEHARLERQHAQLRAALVGVLGGVDGREELTELRVLVKHTAPNAETRDVSLAAIDALIATLPDEAES